MLIRGTVVKGKGEGKKLGFPTANLDYASEVVVESGVYAARALSGGRALRAAAVIGMWKSDGKPSVEVHLIGEIERSRDREDRDLYGQEIVVALIEKIRDLKKFENEDELIAQIRDDIAVCSQRLKQNSG